MNRPAEGSCLCGAVRFTVKGAFESFYLCHCSRCRKASGTAHAANLFSSAGTLAWVSGEDRVKAYQHPGTRYARAFCADCGSALPFASANGLVVPAGSLDTDVAIVPDSHIFTASRASWDHGLESVPGCLDAP